MMNIKVYVHIEYFSIYSYISSYIYDIYLIKCEYLDILNNIYRYVFIRITLYYMFNERYTIH